MRTYYRTLAFDRIDPHMVKEAINPFPITLVAVDGIAYQDVSEKECLRYQKEEDVSYLVKVKALDEIDVENYLTTVRRVIRALQKEETGKE